jgi:hypothetical protein
MLAVWNIGSLLPVRSPFEFTESQSVRIEDRSEQPASSVLYDKLLSVQQIGGNELRPEMACGIGQGCC